jgi:hypothetical protein
MFGTAPIANVRGAIALIERDPPEQVPTHAYSRVLVSTPRGGILGVPPRGTRA